MRDQPQKYYSIIIGFSEPGSKKDQKASDLLHGAPQVRTQHQDLLEGEDTGGSEKVIENKESKVKKSVPKSPSVARTRPRGTEKTTPRKHRC